MQIVLGAYLIIQWIHPICKLPTLILVMVKQTLDSMGATDHQQVPRKRRVQNIIPRAIGTYSTRLIPNPTNIWMIQKKEETPTINLPKIQKFSNYGAPEKVVIDDKISIEYLLSHSYMMKPLSSQLDLFYQLMLNFQSIQKRQIPKDLISLFNL